MFRFITAENFLSQKSLKKAKKQQKSEVKKLLLDFENFTVDSVLLFIFFLSNENYFSFLFPK